MDIIINPIAGGKRGRKIKKALKKVTERLEERKIEYKIHFSKYKGHATILTQELIKGGAKTIVAMGGDGTLHEIINGFSDFDNVALGIIPCGTGNDFVSALKIPLNPIKAVDLIIDGQAKYTDFMQLPTVRGLNVAGMGIDVDVLVKYSKLKHKNKFGYMLSLLKTLCKFDYTAFTAEINGQSKDYSAFIAAVANGNVYGGGIKICPPANPTDKKLDFLTVNEIPKSKILGALIKLLRGKIINFKQTEHYTCEKIKITAKSPYIVNVDGELYRDIPFEVEIVSDKLRIFR